MTGGFPKRGLVTRKMFPFDDVIMCYNTPPSTSIYVVPASCAVLALTSLSALLVLCEGNTRTPGRNVHMCVHCCHKMAHCGIFIWYILRFVRWVYQCSTLVILSKAPILATDLYHVNQLRIFDIHIKMLYHKNACMIFSITCMQRNYIFEVLIRPNLYRI